MQTLTDWCCRSRSISKWDFNMVTKQEVIELLPKFRNEKRLLVFDQTTDNIIDEILKTHEKYTADYDKIYFLFDQVDTLRTGKEIFKFCKKYLPYKIERPEEQTVKSPSAILHPGEKIDCKHYSLFIGGVLDALQRAYPGNWDWCYRFASYGSKPEIEHVFVVLVDNGTEYMVDPVLDFFDEKKQPTFIIDEKPMSLYSISGINDQSLPVVTVDPAEAEKGFLLLVNTNAFNLRDLLKNNMDITRTEVKKYFEARGYNYENLLNVLKSTL